MVLERFPLGSAYKSSSGLKTFPSFRDGSLITCGEGVEDILIYLMEFSSPSQIYVNILIPTPGSQNKLHSPSREMLFIFQPLPLSVLDFGPPLPDVFHPLPWKN